MRRIEVNMSQQVLGGHIDLTFQQIQKYEKGMNRIGASRLQQIGKILEVPAAYFFEGAPGGWEPAGASGDRTANTFLELLGTRRTVPRRAIFQDCRRHASARRRRPDRAAGRNRQERSAKAKARSSKAEMTPFQCAGSTQRERTVSKRRRSVTSDRRTVSE
jgi:transcriptional regulator with XRE-family HTH domain